MVVVLSQSVEQMCRELEQADVASVARLVRVVLLLSPGTRTFVLITCMLWW